MKSIRRETLYGIWTLATTANTFCESESLQETIDTSRDLYLAMELLNKRTTKIKNGVYDELCKGCKQVHDALGENYDDIYNFLSNKSPIIEKSYESIKKML